MVPGMARKLRMEYRGAIYHLMNRGDRREPIFKDNQDRDLFLITLGEAGAKTDSLTPTVSWGTTFIWWWTRPVRLPADGR